MTIRTHRVSSTLGLALLFLAFGSVGCRDSSKSLAAADAAYQVQGTVQRLDGHQKGFREVVVRHQSVDQFRNRDGEVVGMDSMAMPFAVLDALNLDGVEAGDAVLIDFEVRWETDPVLLITHLSELPDGTVIDFGSNRGSEEGDGSKESDPGEEPTDPGVSSIEDPGDAV